MICLSFLFAGLAAANTQVRAFDLRQKSEWDFGKEINPPYIINNTPDVPENSESLSEPKTGTVIENKNVNVVVNVDPKDVAKELYKLIEVRSHDFRRSDNKKLKIDEIEKIIRPMVSTTRRSNRPTPFEIAYALDHVTRQSLYGDRRRPTIEDEITTRKIVAKMMTMLKAITENKKSNKLNDDNDQNFTRRMIILSENHIDYENSNDDDDNDADNIDDDDENDEVDDNDDGDDDDDVDNDDDDDDEYINLKLKIRKSDLLESSKSVTYVDF